MVLASQYNPGP